MKDQTPYDAMKTIKQGFIYLLIAFPFVLFVATVLTIIKAPLWAIMLCNVVAGGGVVFLVYIIHNKIKEKAKIKREKDGNFDPFKD